MFSRLCVAMFASAACAAAACEDLSTLKLEKAAVTSVRVVEAGAFTPPGGRAGQGANPFQTLPAFCRVQATLTPTSDSHIEMELWMPSANWNGRFLAVGNGGWAGNIELGAMATGLAKGYATASNDTGHKGASASFAVDHPEKLVDFGYRSMHEMAIQSKAIIRAFYSREPQRSYYQGCSTGGRQGLMEAQRYPDDFDGIIAGAPVNNVVHLNMQAVARQVDMLREPARILPASKVTLFATAVIAACDAKDGVTDGIISDPQTCRFDPAELQCKTGDGPDCLTAAQVETAKRAWAPVRTKTGEVVYPGSSPGFESGYRMPSPGVPINPLFTDMARYVGHQDAEWDVLSFDLDADLALAMKNAAFLESTDPQPREVQGTGWKAAALSRLGGSRSGSAKHDRLFLSGRSQTWRRPGRLDASFPDARCGALRRRSRSGSSGFPGCDGRVARERACAGSGH